VDPVGGTPFVTRRTDRIRSVPGIAAILLGLFAAQGCFGPTRGPAPPPPDLWTPPASDNAGGGAASAVFPPVVPIPEPRAAPAPPTPPAADNQAQPPKEEEAAAPVPALPGVLGVPPPKSPGALAVPGAETPARPPQTASRRAPEVESPGTSAAGSAARRPSPQEGAAARPKAAPRPEPEAPTREAQTAGPAWARQNEVLSYRVDFIGITMGYARFSYRGKVSIGGRIAYHLSVRAWTSGLLSYIYPINETIDYYLDAATVAPIRQEFTAREREKDDVAIYDQETGKITYRYRDTGELRKEVQTVPDVYDPVSAVYYFRWKDLGGEEKPRNVYAGRKLYQISARILGKERLDTEFGPVETLVIQPVIRREGKPDNKGDLKMWVSDDERRVPVRLYAKFHKIKDWTLVGELVPEEKRG
jgi:hypothetical protein